MLTPLSASDGAKPGSSELADQSNRGRSHARVAEQSLAGDEDALLEESRRRVTRQPVAVRCHGGVEGVDCRQDELTSSRAIRDGLTEDVCAISTDAGCEAAPLMGATRASQVIVKRAKSTCMRVQGSPRHRQLRASSTWQRHEAVRQASQAMVEAGLTTHSAPADCMCARTGPA